MNPKIDKIRNITCYAVIYRLRVAVGGLTPQVT